MIGDGAVASETCSNRPRHSTYDEFCEIAGALIDILQRDVAEARRYAPICQRMEITENNANHILKLVARLTRVISDADKCDRPDPCRRPSGYEVAQCFRGCAQMLEELAREATGARENPVEWQSKAQCLSVMVETMKMFERS